MHSLQQGASLVRRHRVIMNETSLAMTYWRQRIKDRHLQLGDIPSKFLFNRLRQKKHQNFVYMLRTSSGDWVDTHQDIANLLQSYFKDIFRVDSDSPIMNTHHGSKIDLVLRELNLPSLSERARPCPLGIF